MDPVIAPDEPTGPTQPTDPEDDKLMRLARSAAGRTAGIGAAVRDEIGRTYLAGPVELRTLRLTALQVAVAQAIGSGASRLDAVALVGFEPDQDADLLAELGDPLVVRG